MNHVPKSSKKVFNGSVLKTFYI